jgi:hypothetical protein
LLAAIFAGLWIKGRHFYPLNVVDRLDHPDNRLLASGELVGHGYGVLGTALIATNLFYMVRRKLAAWKLGSMRVWLDVHVTTGLVGSLLVVFHSAFLLRTWIATTTMIALFAALVTGVIGRYIYSLTPKPDLERLERYLTRFDGIGPGMGKAMRARLAAVPPTTPRRSNLLSIIAAIPAWIREAGERRRAVLEIAAEHEIQNPTEVRLLTRRISVAAEIAAAQVRAAAADTVLRSWRALHRISALVLIALVIVHIATAWYYGYRWIFSE